MKKITFLLNKNKFCIEYSGKVYQVSVERSLTRLSQVPPLLHTLWKALSPHNNELLTKKTGPIGTIFHC